MGNAAHPLNKAAGMEVIASQDCLLVLSYGSRHGTTGQRACRSSFSTTQYLKHLQLKYLYLWLKQLF